MAIVMVEFFCVAVPISQSPHSSRPRMSLPVQRLANLQDDPSGSSFLSCFIGNFPHAAFTKFRSYLLHAICGSVSYSSLHAQRFAFISFVFPLLTPDPPKFLRFFVATGAISSQFTSGALRIFVKPSICLSCIFSSSAVFLST